MEETSAEIVLKFPSEKEEQAQVALRTYYVYLQAFSSAIENSAIIRVRQTDIPGFEKLQMELPDNIDRIKQALCRGWFTLKAMHLLPVDAYPVLAATANFWAPVQAYYVIHGLGIAALLALRNESPEKIIELLEHQRLRS